MFNDDKVLPGNEIEFDDEDDIEYYDYDEDDDQEFCK